MKTGYVIVATGAAMGKILWGAGCVGVTKKEADKELRDNSRYYHDLNRGGGVKVCHIDQVAK